MSALKIFADSDPSAVLFTSADQDDIAGQLKRVGVRFEQ
jgi:cupin superfamily acireductone dioxygenase involved in methionine salvage